MSEQAEEYAPDPTVEWCVRVALAAPLSPADVQPLSHALHEAGVPHMLHGRLLDGRWTYAIARDVEGPFDELAFALRYVTIDDQALPAEHFRAAYDAISELDLGALFADRTPAGAAERSAELSELVATLDHHVELQLVAEAPFERARVHDLLIAHGLLPTDGPLYEPGGAPDSYAVEVYDDVLRFYFDVPRVKDVAGTFDAMWELIGAMYPELPGAQLATEDGHSPGALRSEALAIAHELVQAGFEPGAPSTLFLF